jgi:SPX domain protein involved in polyphosphate accumulation
MADAAATVPYVRSFNRFELKYVLRWAEAEAFARELEGFAERDPHAAHELGYPVHSIYWDSPELDAFWEKIDGQKYRRKLRFRRYGDSEDAFVEIKQRIDRTVQKRRVRLPQATIARVFWGERSDLERDEEALGDPVCQEALLLLHARRLKPVLCVSYRRLAYFAAFEHDLRITIDSRLMYDPRALDIRQPFGVGKSLLDPRFAVLEIKYNHRVPVWLTKLAARHELRLIRYSKYCAAVDREFFNGRYV